MSTPKNIVSLAVSNVEPLCVLQTKISQHKRKMIWFRVLRMHVMCVSLKDALHLLDMYLACFTAKSLFKCVKVYVQL